MKFTVHAGHNPDGKTACGAIGLIIKVEPYWNVNFEYISRIVT